MAVHGPIPKRSDQRRRRNVGDPIDAAPGAPTVDAPPADAAWHPVAVEWYAALADSGQSAFYEPSDWAFARLLAHLMTEALSDGKLNGQLITAILSAMGELLTTEGARRRARLELERGGSEADPAHEHAVATITALRARG